jgi:hypothetical protein
VRRQLIYAATHRLPAYFSKITAEIVCPSSRDLANSMLPYKILHYSRACAVRFRTKTLLRFHRALPPLGSLTTPGANASIEPARQKTQQAGACLGGTRSGPARSSKAHAAFATKTSVRAYSLVAVFATLRVVSLREADEAGDLRLSGKTCENGEETLRANGVLCKSSRRSTWCRCCTVR